MKKSTFMYGVPILYFSLFFASCSGQGEKFHDASEELMDKPPQTNEENDPKYLADMENYRKKVMLDIEENNHRIIELKNIASTQSKEIRLRSLGILDQLERQNKSMEMKMIDYTGDGIENWRSFKAEFSSDMKTLSNSLKTLKSSKSFN